MVKVEPIPAFYDNYIWAIIHPPSQHCVLVDPGDAEPALDFLQKNQLTLDSILITHHHADHCGGLPKLLENYTIPIYAPHGLLSAPHLKSIASDLQNREAQKSKACHFVMEGDVISLFNNAILLHVIETPGHTLDHIVFYGHNMLFCGDTLFSAGCGRIFEGTEAQMWSSIQKLLSLPDETCVYCAHEYTLDNLKFALTIEPQNHDIKLALNACNRSTCTLPSTIEKEKKINPYFRTHIDSIKEHLNKDDGFQIFKEIRTRKDHWK